MVGRDAVLKLEAIFSVETSKHSSGLHGFFFAVALRPNAGHGLLILEVF